MRPILGVKGTMKATGRIIGPIIRVKGPVKCPGRIIGPIVRVKGAVKGAGRDHPARYSRQVLGESRCQGPRALQSLSWVPNNTCGSRREGYRPQAGRRQNSIPSKAN